MKFEISAIIPLAILFLVNSIQAMGDFSATTSGGMDRLPTDRELNGGIRPATRRIPADVANTLLEITFVVPTMPTF